MGDANKRYTYTLYQKTLSRSVAIVLPEVMNEREKRLLEAENAKRKQVAQDPKNLTSPAIVHMNNSLLRRWKNILHHSVSYRIVTKISFTIAIVVSNCLRYDGNTDVSLRYELGQYRTETRNIW